MNKLTTALAVVVFGVVHGNVVSTIALAEEASEDTAIETSGADEGGSSLLGFWMVDDGGAIVDVQDCEGKLCGDVVWFRTSAGEINPPDARDVVNEDEALRDRPICGLPILWDLQPRDSEGTAFKNGRVYDAENGKTYKANVKLNDEGLFQLRGYIGRPAFGRTKVWSRVAEDFEPCQAQTDVAAGAMEAAQTASDSVAASDDE